MTNRSKHFNPVAWRVKDAAGEWVLFTREAEALSYKAQTGGGLQGLYIGRDAESLPTERAAIRANAIRECVVAAGSISTEGRGTFDECLKMQLLTVDITDRLRALDT